MNKLTKKEICELKKIFKKLDKIPDIKRKDMAHEKMRYIFHDNRSETFDQYLDEVLRDNALFVIGNILDEEDFSYVFKNEYLARAIIKEMENFDL